MSRNPLWLPVATALSTLVAACQASPPPAHAVQAPASAPASQRPSFRLPTQVQPVHYTLDLAIDPRQPELGGTVDIDLVVHEPVTRFWLHGRNLSLDEVTLEAGGKTLAAQTTAIPGDLIEIAAGATLPPGLARVRLRYRAPIERTDTYGVFAQTEDGRPYVYTQFEALAARRAFPCFDEPAMKVPWHLRITTPTGFDAFSNAPVASKRDDGGHTIYDFAETKPLPPYLVAFAVGTFDVVDAGTSASGVPIRIITPRGHGEEATFARSQVAPILSALESYVGRPYPFAKLDHLVVPKTVGFSAMEHPGLITYTQTRILAPPGTESLQFRQLFVYTAAHELGHQWFGDLVSPSFWDDLWLNESFASWTEYIAIRALYPQWSPDLDQREEASIAMRKDALQSARRVHQPVTDENAIDSAFDSITYLKGGSLLAMMEHWLGPKTFQRAIRAYLKEHAWSVASTQDFLGALDAVHPGAGAVMGRFVEQVGVPELSFHLACTDRGATLRVGVERYRTMGSKSGGDGPTWSIPVCLRTAARDEIECHVVDGSSTEIPLGASCPAWVDTNAGGYGYYRSVRDESVPLEGAWPHLQRAERWQALSDLIASAAAGKRSLDAVLATLGALPVADDPRLLAQAASFMTDLAPYVGANDRAHFAAFVRQRFGARARELGWQPRAGESEDVLLLRREIVPLVAMAGNDPALARQATELAERELSNPGTLSRDTVDIILNSAAYHGKDDLYQRYRATARAAPSRTDRNRWLQALAYFPSADAIEKTLSLMLDPAFDIRDTEALIGTTRSVDGGARQAFEFVISHLDALRDRLPESQRAELVRTVVHLCQPTDVSDARQFVDSYVRAQPGGPQAAAQALEEQQMCLARMAQYPKALSAFLARSGAN